MSSNPFVLLRKLLPEAPLQVGVVTAVSGGGAAGQLATIALPGGGTLQVRGAAIVGHSVFVRDGVIEGEAPALPTVVIDI